MFTEFSPKIVTYSHHKFKSVDEKTTTVKMELTHPGAMADEQPEMYVVPVELPTSKRRSLAGPLVVFVMVMATIAVGAVVAMKPKSSTHIAGASDIPGFDEENSLVERKVQSSTQTVFCVIADTPYNPSQRTELKAQLNNLASDCEFLVHLGDIKSGQTSCIEYIYQDMRSMLLRSHAPSFIVPGDNEWNDCPQDQISDGWTFWNRHLLGIVDSWNHGFNIIRLHNRPENVYFVHKRTLFIMLNLPGGQIIDGWDSRQSDLAQFTIGALANRVPNEADGVVIMGHAHPYSKHDSYFNPVFNFISNNMPDIPFLYIHGDGHAWEYERRFGGVRMLRIQTVGGTSELPLKMIVDPHTQSYSVSDTFKYVRYY